MRQRYPIDKLALFGSVVRNDFKPGESDVDILVSFNGPVGWDFFDLENDLSRIIGEKVDLVAAKAIKPHYWPYIEKDLSYV